MERNTAVMHIVSGFLLCSSEAELRRALLRPDQTTRKDPEHRMLQ